MDTVHDLIERQGIPVFTNLEVALSCTSKVLKENLCIEELAMLISAQIPELSDSDDSSSTTDAGSRLEKGSILQDTVDKLKSLRAQLKVRLLDERNNQG